MESEGLGYWTKYSLRRRISRRQMLRGGAIAGTGLLATAMGCGGGERPKEAATPQGGGATTAPKLTSATLRSAIGSDVGSMDPQSLGGTGGGNWPNQSTHFGGLLSVKPGSSEPVGEELESYEVLEGGKAWKLKVRPNVKFHNGEVLTGEAVKFNFDRMLGRVAYNPQYQSGHKAQFEGLVGDVEVVDPMTVIVHMQKLDAAFPFRLGQSIVPMDYVKKVGDTEFAAKPIGAGPFRFVSRVPDSEIRSTRFDEYFRPVDSQDGPRMPVIKDLIQKIIPEDQARVAALQAGEVDLIHNVSADLARQLEGQKGIKVVYLPGDQPMHIHINTFQEKDPQTGQPNPWRDKRVRQAANYAIDLDTIIKTILTGKEKRSYGSAQRSFGFPKDIFQKTFKYDPQRAKQLLTEAGYPNGFSATLYGPIGRWPNSRQIMEAIAGYLSKVGINTSIQELQYQVVTTKFKDRSLYPLSFWGMSGGPDAGVNWRYGYHSKGAYTMSVPDPVVDEWIEASEQEFDPKKRADLVVKVITKFYEDAQWIFLYEPTTVVAMTDKWSWEPYYDVLSNPEYWNIRPAQM